MIKLIDNFEEYDFSSFEKDVFFYRIYSDFKTLSSFDDALFYVCLSGEKINAFFSKVGSIVTVSCSDNSACEEINEFLKVTGFSKILCDKSISSYFDGEKTSGDILKLNSVFNDFCKSKQLYTENLNDMYLLVKENFKIEFDFPEWFVDMSYRLRHNSAKFYGVYEEDKLVSGAFSLFETENTAIISSVATDVKHRGKGYGEDVVRSLLKENENKNVYVFVENEKIKKWYIKMGFMPDKMWSEIENVL